MRRNNARQNTGVVEAGAPNKAPQRGVAVATGLRRWGSPGAHALGAGDPIRFAPGTGVFA